MRLYKGTNWKLYHGNMLDMGEIIEPNSIDSIVTDPPYELNFMGKGWDNSGIAFQSDTWSRCFDALKPGGYLLAFGGSRTFHRIAVAIEDAGFEIRDVIMWLYGSGFPKSMNIGLAIDKKNGIDNRTGNVVKGVGSNNTNSMKNGLTESQEFSSEYEERKAQNEWDGWGTCLKPSYEPVIVARKPCDGTCVDNVLKYGVGGINIDECRVGGEPITHSGRFPANTILTYDETDFDEVCGGMPETKSNGGAMTVKKMYGGAYISSCAERVETGYIAPSDSGSASRYFYCAKASKRDRDEGLDLFSEIKTGELQGGRVEGSAGSIMQNKDGGVRVNPYAGAGTPKKNIHPTVKPTSLMQYLVRLVTPKGGTVLDPFNGSGSTGKAVMYENKDRNAGYKYIGIELTEDYIPIAAARIDYAIGEESPASDENDLTDGVQMSIFDFIGG